jgi:hypothetical protein
MDQFVKGLVDDVGLDQKTAEKVFDFVKDHWDEVPRWIARSMFVERGHALINATPVKENQNSTL